MDQWVVDDGGRRKIVRREQWLGVVLIAVTVLALIVFGSWLFFGVAAASASGGCGG